jgi:OOP family OmpA-OmpF porin
VGVSAGIGFLDIDPDPLNQARIVTPHGTLYTQTMYSGYFSHAFDHYHFTGPDYAGSDYFSERAIAAAGGQAPAPASAPAGEAAAARDRLVTALTRYSVAEVDAAKAQVAYDCWVYGMANNHAEEAGQCRASFLNHVDKVETAVAEQDLEVLVMIPMRQRVLFDTDVSDVDDYALPVFAALTERLSLLSVAKIYVAGHADKPGTPEYNLTLSEKRAASVTAALIEAGVPEVAIVAEAFGSADPIGNNPYDALNRRVDIVIEPIAVNAEAVKQAVQRMKAME